jgi:hypothetical protein
MCYRNLYVKYQNTFTVMQAPYNFVIYLNLRYIRYIRFKVLWHIKTAHFLHFKALTKAFTVRFASTPRASKGM